MRSKVFKFILIPVLGLGVFGLGFLLYLGYLGSGTVLYHVQKHNLDTEALGSFHQEIVYVNNSGTRPVFEIAVNSGS